MLRCLPKRALRHLGSQSHPHRHFRDRQSALARFLSSLAVLEHCDGKLQHASLSAVTAARKLGGSVTGIVAGSGVKSVAGEAASVKGVEKIIMVENGSYDKVILMAGAQNITLISQ